MTTRSLTTRSSSKTRRSLLDAATALAVGLAMFGLPGCASRGQQSVGEYLDDSGTTTRVKTRLIEDDLVGSFQLRVDTIAGVVRLGGTVKTQAQSQRAEALTRDVYGVKEVRNEILVRP